MVFGLNGRAGLAACRMPATTRAAATIVEARYSRVTARGAWLRRRRCPLNAPNGGPEGRARLRKSLVRNTVAQPTEGGMQGQGRSLESRRWTERQAGEPVLPRKGNAGWVARTRSLAGPLSPRGPQPVVPM